MDSMAPASSLCLFKETRISLQPTRPSSVIQIHVPSTSSFRIRSRQQRHILRTAPIYDDEISFTKHCLATSSSLFLGHLGKSPRSFLWRVLSEGKVLELRSVDLSKSNTEAREAALVIQLHFTTAIKHGGVALAESQEQDIISVFVLTRGNELYTFGLRKDFFCHAAASEEDIGRWCKVAKPATFSISTPHSLIAGSSQQLIVSLTDGRLLQLTRKKEDDGSKWYESTYGDGQWGSSLRGLVRWQGSNTVRFDGNVLEQTTPIAMAISPDKMHIFAVCLNHTLKIWNPNKAASAFSKDLLCQHREPHEIPKLMMDPASPNVLQVFQVDTAMEGDAYYAVTFSPHDFGQFIFWGIRDPDYGDRGVRDLFSEETLKPPDPDPDPESKAIWKVADFRIKSGQYGNGTEIWILMRSSRLYKLYCLKFELSRLPDQWQDQWSTVAFETKDRLPQFQISNLDSTDATDSWLDFIFYPDRYPESVLETALAAYCSERSVSLSTAKAPLKERMCSAIALQVTSANTDTDFEKYRQVTEQEWNTLWQNIHDLHTSRWDILSLIADDHTEMPWMTFTDGCSTIRSCSRVELIAQNDPETLAESLSLLEQPSIEMDAEDPPKLPDELALIIEAAANFRQSFSHRLQKTCNNVLATELWVDPPYSVPLRIQAFYDKCNFAEEIGSVPFDNLVNILEPIQGFNGLETETFLAILGEFSHTMPNESAGSLFTEFGLRLLLAGAREMIDIGEKILYDLLTLVVFVDMEIEREETPMENFESARIYLALLDLLRQYKLMQWLSGNTQRTKDDSNKDSVMVNGTSSVSSEDKPFEVDTILKSVFAINIQPQFHGTQPQSVALTGSIQDLLIWVFGGTYPVPAEQVPVYVQCSLLKNKNVYLASDLLQYQPSTAWATYIKGRLYLLRGEFTEAAIVFKKAAYKLSRPDPSIDYQGASNYFLSPMEAVHFGQGLSTYYTHVLNLFDSFSAPTQMAQIARLALQLGPSSPTPTDQTTTLLTSLFQASLQVTDFSSAYSALIRHRAPKTLLPTLISSLLTTPDAQSLLLSLPFPPNLYPDIDAILSSHKQSPKILAAWRLHHNDCRGAAAALLAPLQQALSKVKRDDEGLEDSFLAVINLLACAGDSNGWVLYQDDANGKSGLTGTKTKRRIVTIDDVRSLYQKELDRRSIIEGGRFGFAGEGVNEMDIL